MKKIKFSHWYYKFDNVLNDLKGFKNTAILLMVLKIHKSDISSEFEVFDTAYNVGHYELPKSEYYLLLLFSSDFTYTIFPTIRRFTPQKYDYYKTSVGERFEVVLTSISHNQ